MRFTESGFGGGGPSSASSLPPMQPAPSLPLVWLGLAGFSAESRALLEQVARSFCGDVRWRLAAFADADAWLLNGAKVQVLEANCIRVPAGVPTERSVRLSMQDVNRPVAFAAPLAEGFEPLYSFNPALPQTLHQTLAALADWLMPLQGHYALGREVVLRGHALRHGVFHVCAGPRLLAVVNLQNGKVAVSPALAPADLVQATWTQVPPAAGGTPPGFTAMTVAQLSWAYVRHSDDELLPPRYHFERIYFRAAPKVPLNWISDTQLALMRELNGEPATMAELRQRTALPLEQIEKDLACLYFARSITTTAAKATRPSRAGCDPSSSGPEIADLMRATESPDAPTGPGQVPGGLTRQYATVPAPLMMMGG